MDNKIPVKPCPFCGSKDSYIFNTSYDDFWYGCRMCNVCEAKGPDVPSGNDPDEPPWKEEADRKWNMRENG